MGGEPTPGHEKEVIGFYITGHPLARYERQLRLYAIANTQSLREFQDGEKVSLGGMIFKTRLQTTRKGDRMAFVTLEDVQGQVDVIVFPEVYKEFGGGAGNRSTGVGARRRRLGG